MHYKWLHCVVPPHDKLVSATMHLLQAFVESGVTIKLCSATCWHFTEKALILLAHTHRWVYLPAILLSAFHKMRNQNLEDLILFSATVTSEFWNLWKLFSFLFSAPTADSEVSESFSAFCFQLSQQILKSLKAFQLSVFSSHSRFWILKSVQAFSFLFIQFRFLSQFQAV